MNGATGAAAAAAAAPDVLTQVNNAVANSQATSSVLAIAGMIFAVGIVVFGIRKVRRLIGI